ncbi:MAG: amidohydrolase family protein [Anaerolineae bacterium]|nr:amidohydrolase family protein [Anaerolineae bacterium]
MIVDCHVHIGKILTFDMSEALLLHSMDKYHIDYALVSNIEGSEVDGYQMPIPPDQQISQRAVNEKVLRLARSHPDRFGALFWIKPATEGCTPEFAALVADNRDIVYGLKVHPYLSKTAFDSPQVTPYIELAEQLDLVVVTHTANDRESSPRAVYEAARRHPAVNIVLYHMGLGTDNQEAITLVSELPNLYGDCCWVTPGKTREAIHHCGSHKILFGTDNPINGLDTYDDSTFYRPYFNAHTAGLAPEHYDQFMYGNAVRLFKLNQFANAQ